MSAISREAPHSYEDALRVAREILSRRRDLVAQGLIETEAERVVEGAFEKVNGKPLSRSELQLRLRDRLPAAEGEAVLRIAMARAQGMPLQYATGFQRFLEHSYAVGPGVLVPRPETELLARTIIEDFRARGAEPRRGIEVGLGSGAIAIELLAAFGALRMRGTELSPKAADYARRNAERVLGPGYTRLEVIAVEDDRRVLEPFGAGEAADFLVTNPPYLSEIDEVADEVREHEPAEALFAPAGDPLYFYRRVAEGARPLLAPGGLAYAEIPHTQAIGVHRLFARAGWAPEILKDLTGRPRILRARLLD